MPPNIASFAKSIIKDASDYALNFHEPDGESNFPDLYEEFMDNAMRELEKYKQLNPNDPKTVSLFKEMTSKYNDAINDMKKKT